MRLRRTETIDLIEWRLEAESDLDDFSSMINMKKDFHGVKILTTDLNVPYIVIKKKKKDVGEIDRDIVIDITDKQI